MKNKFNRLTSKEWLPFQKSWFKYTGDEELYRQNLRFFCHAEPVEYPVYYFGPQSELFKSIAIDEQISVCTTPESPFSEFQFALLDLQTEVTTISSTDEWFQLRNSVIDQVKKIKSKLEYRRFLCILIPQIYLQNQFLPVAWEMAEAVSGLLTLKDEKIAGIQNGTEVVRTDSDYFASNQHFFYALYFRKDENNPENCETAGQGFIRQTIRKPGPVASENRIPAWFILKPPPRRKNEILHPAKYPEDLTTMFIQQFTQPGENVFDPMSGTGSTQVAALKSGRNGYGTELSSFFADIANDRCREIVAPPAKDLFSKPASGDFKIVQKDARQIAQADFPPFHYIITSPPYWDMLNMKGAEYQATRKSKGLQLNYSEDDRDLGNINDYRSFVDALKSIYFHLADLLLPGRYMTIVVKNIKKKGRNYPFAWDLGRLLQEKMILLPESFWCQDDISIAPYGYGNTWVSNTFHQYCLTFQKPV